MLGPSRTPFGDGDGDAEPARVENGANLGWLQGKTTQFGAGAEAGDGVRFPDDRPKDRTPKGADPLGGLGSILLDAHKRPGRQKREPLGEKEIDGRRVIGFRIVSPTATLEVWGDPKTGMPIRIDMTTKLMPET